MNKEPVKFSHSELPKVGVLLTNLGTPDEPTPEALKRYLKEFLWDPRIVEIPRPIWWFILNGIILKTRPAKSAEAYKSIWTETGSPLLSISKKQRAAVEANLSKRVKCPLVVSLGMRYGNPSIESALTELRQANVQKLVVLPLYPQSAAASTLSTFDAVAKTYEQWRYIPETRFINHYHDNADYIASLVKSIQQFWDENGKPEQLMFSFHGIPKRALYAGDAYYCQCQKTARLISEALNLEEEKWIVVFQSRFGREKWLQPYASDTLEKLGKEGLDSIDVVCPGFSADCLETLEEMAVENKEVFKQAGGGQYRYISALNDNDDHIQMISNLLFQNLQGWPEITEWDEEQEQEKANARTYRAKKLGAKR